ncbi:TnsD family Tn7-like transposition protein [Pseudoalteromonas sp. T1lg10]|uniref:TnsD family Tn7-like transposition protein n=1 Tax=Pseudoalteromonas sp. T1lg10 TaxID=2077093 RepID=UPI000CF6CBDF|nr:TnsD family Tn7-like transposition protein [Pseudoalteromonas sp. T1lg10]
MDKLRLLPGECGYSLAARAHLLSPYGSWKVTNQTLFGRESVRINALLPGHLSSLALLADSTVEHLRLEASAHPLVAFGLSDKEKRLALANSEVQNNASTVYEQARMAASKLSFGYVLKCCCACMEEDKARYGLAYWHTMHQLHGVSVCPVHARVLSTVEAGEGALNHAYELPFVDNTLNLEVESNALKLSRYIVELHALLSQFTPLGSMSERYIAWLDAKGFITAGGRIRWKQLKKELQRTWLTLFDVQGKVLPPELSTFHFVPRLVHQDAPTHYIRHVLLMAYLTDSPEQFFAGQKSKSVVIPHQKTHTVPEERKVLQLLKQHCSLRQCAAQLKCSVGYVKGVALRHQITIERRRKRITPQMERCIWRKAFVGQHRQDIAQQLGLSIGAVEQVIQSHAGLSAWRHHLLMQQRKLSNRTSLINFMRRFPDASRNVIKHQCNAYMWLYKHDKAWLYAQLPEAKSPGKPQGINWAVRDLVLCDQLEALQGKFTSLSAIDRAVGGHSWLRRYREKVPLAFGLAQQILARGTSKE